MLSCLLVSYENPLQAANFTVRYRLLHPWQLVWSPLPIDINLTAHTFTYMLIWDSFIIYMSCPLNFPEPLPHTSLPVFGSTSVSLILPTIQARPVTEWKYKSRFPITLSFRAVKAGTILTSLQHQRWVCDPSERTAAQWLCDGYREGHWARLKSHLPKDFSATGMGRSAFVFFWDLEP